MTSKNEIDLKCGKTWLVRGRGGMCLRAWKESWFSKDHELAGALWDSEHIDLSPKWEVKIAGAGEVLGHTSGFGPQTLLVMCSLKAAEWGADLVEVGTVLHQSDTWKARVLCGNLLD